MPDYSKGKIYRLDCMDLVYIGSTTQSLATRKGKHHTKYKSGTLDCSSKLLYDLANHKQLSFTQDLTIELIEECPCESKEQLTAREGYYIRKFKSEYGDKCVNRCIPQRTYKEYYNDNKQCILERVKDYREANADKLQHYHKMYREQNKERRQEYDRSYYQDNQDKVLEQARSRYTSKRAEILANLAETIQCECGCLITQGKLTKHRKTKKHLDKLAQFQNNE